ncbi:MAG: hypothetical protein PHX83_11910 [Acidobacteriia bacterium]|nr:hypothetical protein [Terriglobia bacterium]
MRKQKVKKCPSCKEAGLVWQPYGMKCAFCDYVEYSRKVKNGKNFTLRQAGKA